MARSGDLIGWIENPSQAGPGTAANAPTTSLLRTLDLTTGGTRDLDLGSTHCVGLSGNARGFVWTGPSKQIATSLSYFDPRAWRSVA